MERPIYNFFTGDHERIDNLLNRAVENPDTIDLDIYHQFRTGLLTHIKMEEKILFPAAVIGNGGNPIPLAAIPHFSRTKIISRANEKIVNLKIKTNYNQLIFNINF